MVEKIVSGDARNLRVLHLILIAFFIIITPALGDVNLTIVSSNNKTIEITNAGTNAILGSINQSEYINLPYDNAIVKIVTANTMTINNLKVALAKAKSSDVVMGIILFIIIAIIFAVIFI